MIAAIFEVKAASGCRDEYLKIMDGIFGRYSVLVVKCVRKGQDQEPT
jgi:hypothetical protein